MCIIDMAYVYVAHVNMWDAPMDILLLLNFLDQLFSSFL